MLSIKPEVAGGVDWTKVLADTFASVGSEHRLRLTFDGFALAANSAWDSAIKEVTRLLSCDCVTETLFRCVCVDSDGFNTLQSMGVGHLTDPGDEQDEVTREKREAESSRFQAARPETAGALYPTAGFCQPPGGVTLSISAGPQVPGS